MPLLSVRIISIIVCRYVEGVAAGGSGTVGGPGLAIITYTSRVSV